MRALTRDGGLSELLLQCDRVALGKLLKRIDQCRGVRHDQDLGSSRGLRDEAPEGRKQIGVETRFRFVEDEQAWRPRRQQRSDP